MSSVNNIIASAKSLAVRMSAFAGLVASVEACESEKLRELLKHLAHQPNISYLWCLIDDEGDLFPAHPNGPCSKFYLRDAIEDCEGYIAGELCLARQILPADASRIMEPTPDLLETPEFATQDIIYVRGKSEIYSIPYTAPIEERRRLSEKVFRPKSTDDTEAPSDSYWFYSEDSPGSYREQIFNQVALRDGDGSYVTKQQMPEVMWPTPNKIVRKGNRTLCYYAPFYSLIDDATPTNPPDACAHDYDRAIAESLQEAEAAKNRAIENHCHAKAKGDIKFRRSLMPYLPPSGRLARESPEYVRQLRECTQASLTDSLELLYEPVTPVLGRITTELEGLLKFCGPDIAKMRKDILSLSAGKHWYDIITAMLGSRRYAAIEQSRLPVEAILLAMVKSAKSQYPFDINGILMKATVGGSAADGKGKI